MKQFHNKVTKNKGFTLIEMVVTMLVFSIIVGAAAGLFVSAIRSQARTLATQRLLDQTSYALEYMGRAMRMARKDIGGTCIADRLNYATTTKGTGGIRFKNYDGNCQEFFREWDAGVYRLKEDKDGSINYLTSADLDVVSFQIGPFDSWDQDDNLQPRVTIFLEIRRAGPKPEEQPKIKIQTTISQRRLDILE